MVDLVFYNGNILTMDETTKEATAIAVSKDKIFYVGHDEGARSLVSDQTKVVDLKGKTLMPSFIESHMHPPMYGLNLLEVNCSAIAVSSVSDILERVREAAKTTPENEWILGWGWDDSALEEKRYPTLQELDEVAPNHPVFLKRTCSHMAILNSKAMALSGIGKDTKDPQGGSIVKDSNGELTGLLQENAMQKVPLPKYSVDDMIKGLKLAQKDFAAWGITTVHDMSTQQAEMIAYQKMLESQALKIRVRPWIRATSHNLTVGLLDEIIALGIRSGFGNDLLRIQGVKSTLDGSVGGRTAALSEPYENDDSKGILYFDADYIAPYVQRAVEAGLRFSMHAIGDRTIEVVLQAFERAQEVIDITEMRNRIEHCALPTDDHLERIKKLGLIAASSVGFLYSIGDSYLTNLGPERMKRVFPHKLFKEYGIVAPGNSDLPVTNGNPWYGIYSAVTRKSMSGQVLDTDQGISVYDAIKAYTVDAAYSSKEEDLIGTIKENAKADFIIIDEDPLSIDVEKLKEIEVQETYLDGKRIFALED